MILHHVADRAGLVVERSPALDSKILGHGDLDALDITPLPEGLQEGVREPKKEHLIDGPLTEVMVDPKDRPLVESIEQRTVEGLRRGAVAAERLFDDHASAVGATRPAQLCHDRPEQRGRDREVVGRALGGAELLTNRIERRRVPVVAVDVAQLTGQLVERRGIESAVLLDAVARPGAELVEPQPAVATPMTGMSRWPRFAIACSAGKIFLNARSPVAPKKTRASEWPSLIASSAWGRQAFRGVRRTRSAWLTTSAVDIPPRRVS